jgi:hypothetical protein
VDIVSAQGDGSSAVRVGSSQGKINANKVPVRASSASREVRDEEQLVGAGSDRGCEGCR